MDSNCPKRPPPVLVFMKNMLHAQYGEERASQMMKDFKKDPDKFSDEFQAAFTKWNHAYDEFKEARDKYYKHS